MTWFCDRYVKFRLFSKDFKTLQKSQISLSSLNLKCELFIDVLDLMVKIEMNLWNS